MQSLPNPTPRRNGRPVQTGPTDRIGHAGLIWLWRTMAFGAALFLLACAALLYSGLRESVFPADVIVVPGNQVFPDGRLSDRLAARLDAACALYAEGLAPWVLVSGGTGVEGVDEAVAMRGYLIHHGVPERAIVTDSNGVTTWATAAFTARWMRERSLERALVVTQYFHTPRTRLALQRFGVPMVGKAFARYAEWRDVYSLLRELPGWVYYSLRPLPKI